MNAAYSKKFSNGKGKRDDSKEMSLEVVVQSLSTEHLPCFSCESGARFLSVGGILHTESSQKPLNMMRSENALAKMLETRKDTGMKYNVRDILGADGRYCKYGLTVIHT